jgi:S1-C subfamily serine protease
MKFTTLNGALAQQLGLRQRAAANGGALITDVQDGSAASKKLEPGDIILGVGNTPVHSADDAVAALKAANPQDGVLLQILKKTETGYAGALIILKDDSPPQP